MCVETPPLSLVCLFTTGYFEYKNTSSTTHTNTHTHAQREKRKRRKTSAYQDNFRCPSFHFYFFFLNSELKEVWWKRTTISSLRRTAVKMIIECVTVFLTCTLVHYLMLKFLLCPGYQGGNRTWEGRKVTVGPRSWNLAEPEPRASAPPPPHKHRITLSWARKTHLQGGQLFRYEHAQLDEKLWSPNTGVISKAWTMISEILTWRIYVSQERELCCVLNL